MLTATQLFEFKAKANEYAETALKLATCDGPPYYYKVAYDEAVAMLERLNVQVNPLVEQAAMFFRRRIAKSPQGETSNNE